AYGAVYMKEKGQRVKIKLQSIIDDSGEKETNTFQNVGQFFKRNNFDVLLYEEIDEAGKKINNFMTIYHDQVNIKRSGFISMNQRFIVNRKTETYYKHPHGEFHMETYTHSLDYHSLRMNSKGKLTIYYTVTLNGEIKRKHLLKLTYIEEGSS